MRKTSSVEPVLSRLPARGPLAELLPLVEELAIQEGCTQTLQAGLHFYRVTEPTPFQKQTTFGPLLMIPVQGRKRVVIDQEEYHYAPSLYFVVTKESSYSGEILEASPGRPYLSTCIELPPELIAKTVLSLADADLKPADPMHAGRAAFVAPAEEAMLQVVLRLLWAVKDPAERKILVPLILEELVFRLLRSDAVHVVRESVSQSGESASIREAIRYMRMNANRSLSVEKVAKHVAMSPSHFAHRFTTIARVSPMRFLKQVRLNEARNQLVRGMRVSEASHAVGYESASHFNRDFKAYFGLAPGAYQKRLRPGSQD